MRNLFNNSFALFIAVLLIANVLNFVLLQLLPAFAPFSWGIGVVLAVYGAFSSQASSVRSETITRGYTPAADRHTERLHRERREHEMTGFYLALLGGSLLLANWQL